MNQADQEQILDASRQLHENYSSDLDVLLATLREGGARQELDRKNMIYLLVLSAVNEKARLLGLLTAAVDRLLETEKGADGD